MDPGTVGYLSCKPQVSGGAAVGAMMVIMDPGSWAVVSAWAESWGRAMPPLWQYFSSHSRKGTQVHLRTQRRRPPYVAHFSCKAPPSRVPKWGAMGAHHGPRSCRPAVYAAELAAKVMPPSWQYLLWPVKKSEGRGVALLLE
jgi:hypothetical protein